MPFIKLQQFSGIAPRVGDTQLAANQAQLAKNVNVTSFELRSWKERQKVYTLTKPNVEAIYKLYNDTTGEFAWFEWSTDVNVAKAPIADDNDFRIYYTGDGAPKKTNWNLATTNGTGPSPYPNGYLSLAVPPPTLAPSLSASGGSGSDEDRAYLYTYVSTFGSVSEESQPSPAALVTCKEAGATVVVSGFTTTGTYNQPGTTTLTVTETAHGLANGDVVYLDFTSGTAPDGQYVVTVTGADTYTINMPAAQTTSGNVTILAKLPSGVYNITHRRIYRTVVGATAVSYQLVEEIPLSTTTYNDTKAVVDLGSLLQTQNWNPPPDNIQGLVSMPNGMMAAFRDNEVWFCEPYHPHAWPDLYTLVLDSKIVGLGVYDTTLVVMTNTQPFLITGGTPLAMTQAKLPMRQPCVSKRSIASDQYGVLYASPNGLVSISMGAQDVVTLPLYTREEWQDLNPASMVGAIYNNMYFGFYRTAAGTNGIILSRGDIPPLVEITFDASTLFVDRGNADIFAVSKSSNDIFQLDADPLNNTFYEWVSKKFVLPNPMNFSAFKVYADYNYIADGSAYDALVQAIINNNQVVFAAANGELFGEFNDYVFNGQIYNGSILQDVPPPLNNRVINISIYGDGVLVWSGNVTSMEPVRLPAEYKAYEFEIHISGNTPVWMFGMATTVGELRELSA